MFTSSYIFIGIIAFDIAILILAIHKSLGLYEDRLKRKLRLREKSVIIVKNLRVVVIIDFIMALISPVFAILLHALNSAIYPLLNYIKNRRLQKA
jgi:hypothetical protein